MQLRYKTILLVLLLVILWAPMLQGLFHFFPETKLKGAYVKPEKPEFLVDSFLTGGFQKKWETWQDHNFGFRASLIRLKNGIEYLLFKEIDNADIIEGRNGYLYSLGSVERTTRGYFYNGKGVNENTISKIKFLKEGIEKRGGHFLLVIAPSKESVIPENLPGFYANAVAINSDYRDLREGYKRNNIPYIDLPEYFRKVQDTTQFQLFTKTGFHWSVYGASLAQDTILKYCQSFLSDPMPTYVRLGIEHSDTARGADADFEEVMNLPFSLQQPEYFYPKIKMSPATHKNKRPKVIIVGDSFFWQIKNLENLRYILSDDSRFWYYFRTAFPLSDGRSKEVKDLDVVRELEAADIVILFGNPSTMGDFPFGVADHYYNNATRQTVVEAIRERIRNNPEWIKKITGKENLPDTAVAQLINKEAKRIDAAKKTIFLRARNGKYVCADGGRSDMVVANRAAPSTWETFSLIELEHNKFAIHSYADRFLSAELAMQSEITASRDKIAEWETFSMEGLDSNMIAFKASNGKYLSVDARSLQLYAKGGQIGIQEKFELFEVRFGE